MSSSFDPGDIASKLQQERAVAARNAGVDYERLAKDKHSPDAFAKYQMELNEVIFQLPIVILIPSFSTLAWKPISGPG